MAVDLRPALAPRSVAIVGASERSFIARVAVENCRSLGYEGEIYPIHPRNDRFLDLPCYPELASLPLVPECTLIALNAERAVGAVEEACRLGVRVVILPAGGFAEQGPDGAERQRRIVEAARASGTLIVGPNCMGVLSPPDRSAVYIGTIARPLHPAGISAIAQSGSVVELLVNTPDIHYARVFSAGNEALLTACDYLEYLLDDVQTEVILLYLEAYREPARLLELAERALDLGKPIIAIALGRSAQAQAMAQAHSGALATSYRRVHAALSQRGVVLCEDLDEWLAAAQLAAHGAYPRGTGIGAVTVSGGEGALLLDLAESCGVAFPPLSERAQRELGTRFPGLHRWPNPADGWDKGPYEEVYPPLLSTLAGEEAVDVLLAGIDVPAGQGEEEATFTSFIGRALGEQAARAGKPAVYLSLTGCCLDGRVRAALDERGTPLVAGARPGLRAIAGLASYTRLRARPLRREQGRFFPDMAEMVANLPGGAADELASRRVLHDAGIPFVRATEVTDAAEAARIARGFLSPVVLKAVLPGVAHKSDLGAVALQLSSGLEVEAAATRLLALCAQHGVPGRLLLSEYVEPAVEAICGIICDPGWGAFVVLGLGGVLAEALDEVAIVAAPLREGQARELTTTGRLGRVLASPRRPADAEALAELVERLGLLAETLWSLDPTLAVDLNPVMVMPPGGGVWAADALITRGAV